MKNQTLPTIEQFRADFPQFDNRQLYPDSQVAFRLAFADRMLNEKRLAEWFPYMACLVVAHYLTLYPRSARSAALGSVDTPGVVNSKSVDKVSIGYDTASTLNPDGGFWNRTTYGAEFYQTLLLFGAGGRQL
ncbi:DUF4054 domain-containing protein [Salmonella enterica]|nr:DUF4054 domain-containing protein [Salmonella enterica]